MTHLVEIIWSGALKKSRKRPFENVTSLAQVFTLIFKSVGFIFYLLGSHSGSNSRLLKYLRFLVRFLLLLNPLSLD